ncbi:hypothetical protein [Alloscardovia macacae]|uniref:hypothetical protein n=1 Tax=Alloscardovia macacae TaxID=1160091 RepID=UPI001178ADC2|nr:hypothetical protein [Alloscardovia macacae]
MPIQLYPREEDEVRGGLLEVTPSPRRASLQTVRFFPVVVFAQGALLLFRLQKRSQSVLPPD